MSCPECRDLSSHTFRGPDDLIHALRLAAEEMNRGVLARAGDRISSEAADDALQSALASGALPGMLEYRFRCELCGDRFTLTGNASDGSGGWTRENEAQEDRP
jgi:hypothetical protein